MFKEQVTACDKIQCLITNFNGFKRVLPNLEVSQEIWVRQSINKISFWMFVVSLFWPKKLWICYWRWDTWHIWRHCDMIVPMSLCLGLCYKYGLRNPNIVKQYFTKHISSATDTKTLQSASIFSPWVHIFSAHPSLKGTRVFLRLLSQL